jgi:hypothetical protein
MKRINEFCSLPIYLRWPGSLAAAPSAYSLNHSWCVDGLAHASALCSACEATSFPFLTYLSNYDIGLLPQVSYQPRLVRLACPQ